MNKNKIDKFLNKVAEDMSKDMPSSREYLVIVANLLLAFVVSSIANDSSLSDLNPYDARSIESFAIVDPENVILQLALQAHVILKLAEIGFPD